MRVWDNTGEVKSDLKSHTSQVISLEYCENNHYMASGGSDNKIIIWNTENYTIHRAYNLINDNNNLMEIEDNDYLSNNNEENKKIKNDEVLDIAWKNSESLLCCTSKGNIYYYKISEDNPIIIINKAHDKDINEIAWNKDKSVFATCSDDGKVKLWKESEEEEVIEEINNEVENNNIVRSHTKKVKISNVSTLDGHSGIVYTMKWSYSAEHNNLLASYNNINIYLK